MKKEELEAHLHNLSVAVEQMRGSWKELVSVRQSFEAIKKQINENINTTTPISELHDSQGGRAKEADIKA